MIPLLDIPELVGHYATYFRSVSSEAAFHVQHDTIAKYTHIIDELLQEAPDLALARHLSGYETSRKPKLLREIPPL